MINKNHSKKAQINQIFVYLVSIITIVFVGFLVLKFITFFIGDVEDRKDSKIYDELKKDFKSVYTNWGSSSVESYIVSDSSDMICFFDSGCDINNSLSGPSKDLKTELFKISSTGNNIALIDNSTSNLLSSSQFENNFNGCFCVNIKQGRFALHYENLRNKVHIVDGDLS